MDQHLALGIFLELAFQRGSLSHILESVLLLLRLWDRGQDNEKNLACTTAPLNPLLKRLEQLSESKCKLAVPRISEEVCNFLLCLP
jgi:E3 ubiquitin-protein ligase HERC2